MRDPAQYFSTDYFEARAKFRAACQARGVTVETYYNPTPGPRATELTTDVAFFGRADAARLVVLASGTHGLEGLTGSGAQVAWIRKGGPDSLPDDVAVLVIHMINPWGSAWRRRQNEDNVDLNRNFVDFSGPLPTNDYYADLQPAIACRDWDGPKRDAARAAITAYRTDRGEKAYASALFQGQYQDDKGIGFGGARPTWSNETIHQILNAHARSAKQIAFIDYHTGLGPYGYGMLINTNEAGSEGLALAKAWFGDDVVAIKTSNDLPYDIQGDMCSAVQKLLEPAVVVTVALEYGTFEVDRLLGLQLDDCWVHNHGDVYSEIGENVRGELQHFFYPAEPEWFAKVLDRSEEIVGRAIRGGV